MLDLVKAIDRAYLSEVNRNENVRKELLEGYRKQFSAKINGNGNIGVKRSGSGKSDDLQALRKEYLTNLAEIRKAESEKASLEEKLYPFRDRAIALVIGLPCRSSYSGDVLDKAVDDALHNDTGYKAILLHQSQIEQVIQRMKAQLALGAKPALIIQREEELKAVQDSLAKYTVEISPRIKRQLQESSTNEIKLKLSRVTDQPRHAPEMEQRTDPGKCERFVEEQLGG